jgi:ABC-type transport system involved in multi-copper enzyme maturation permease subunit
VTATEASSFSFDAPVHHPTLVDVVRSEWLKLRTVRSTFWTLAVVVLIMVGFGALICFAQVATWDQLSPSEQQANPVNGTTSSLAGLLFAQLAMVVLGVLAITSEYSTGGIRSTLVAVPRRSRIVVAKAVVIGLTTLVVGTIASFVAFFAGQAVLATKDFNDSLGDENVLRAVFGSGLYLMACALFGLGIGLCIRSSGGGITVAVAGLFVVPPLSLVIPGEWGEQIQKYVTSNAGQPITDTVTSSDRLGPWVGYLVFSLWWVVLVAAGTWLLKRRDV